MEIFDVVDENGVPTGETIERSKAHEQGIRHRTAHVWVARKNNGKWQVLLQKRAANKDSFPGCYDTSSAGHIHAGDEPNESAFRELEEELGIKADKDDLEFIGRFFVAYEKPFYGKMFKDSEVAFVYVYQKEVDESRLSLQTEEVEGVEWFDIEDVSKALEPRNPLFCVPVGGFKLIKEWCEAHT